MPKMVLLRSREGFDASSLACARHAWLEDRGDQKKAVEGWEKVCGGKVDVVDIPGNHFEVFEQRNVSLSSPQEADYKSSLLTPSTS